ncbi:MULTISPECIES: hypothetical protein [unclassified Microbacterium]|uniref:hypothetical protein n=1 Tax=unclassified Microbacterium TaxID=2609290 RepID=UPI00262FB69E|nr:hypothetical protein [Microbacterium sp.]
MTGASAEQYQRALDRYGQLEAEYNSLLGQAAAGDQAAHAAADQKLVELHAQHAIVTRAFEEFNATPSASPSEAEPAASGYDVGSAPSDPPLPGGYDLAPVVTPVTPSQPIYDASAPTFIRRPSPVNMVPRPLEESADSPLTVIRRDLLAPRAATTSASIGRDRRIAGGLPSWSPVPPGEQLVTRAGDSRSR